MEISFQTFVTIPDEHGGTKPLESGEYDMSFSLYDGPESADPVWGPEIQPDVQVEYGHTRFILGRGEFLGPEKAGPNFSRTLYLGITITGQNNNQELMPRQVLLPGIYAHKAGDSSQFEGHTWSSLEAKLEALESRIAQNEARISDLPSTRYEIVIAKQKVPENQHGGLSANSAWQDRVLQTIIKSHDQIDWYNTDSNRPNQFNLSPGVYHIRGSAPAFDTNHHLLVLDKVYPQLDRAIHGTLEFSNNNTHIQTQSFVSGIVKVEERNNWFKLRHWTDVNVVRGLGYIEANQETPDSSVVFAQLEIIKLE